jgi:hypothetical protein
MDDDGPFRKINYFTGFFLRAEDLQAAEAYRDRLRCAHNLLFHGLGIVKGFRDELGVRVNDRGNEITVGTGLAIDPLGREVLLADPSTHAIRRADYDRQTVLHVTLAHASRQVDFRPNHGNSDYSGHAFTEEFGAVTVGAAEPDKNGIELCRIRLTADGTRVRHAADPAAPGPDEIDLRGRRYSGIARAVFRLADYAEVVAEGDVLVPGKDTARVKVDEVAEGERARVFSVSVYPRAPARVRWYQEALANQRGVTEYVVVLENREGTDALVHYKVYRLG